QSPTATSTAGHEFVLTVVCEDAPGIVHAVTGAIVEVGGNITESRQFESGATHRFYMRLQVRTSASAEEVEQALAPAIERFGLEHSIDEVGRPLRTLILGSTAKHCVNDLLVPTEPGPLPSGVPLLLANPPTREKLAGFYEVPSGRPPTKGEGAKAASEDRVREAVQDHDTELLVLAR